MKRIAAFAAIAAAGIGIGTVALAGTVVAPAGAGNEPIFAGAEWEDDHDDDDRIRELRQTSPMVVPDAGAIRKAGIVRVKEVERDDGRLEVEGYDASGREMKLVMDRDGKRVLSARRDDDRDDDRDD